MVVDSLDEAGHPIHSKLSKVENFAFAAKADWAQESFGSACEVISDGLACLRAVTEVGFHSSTFDREGAPPKDLPYFRWIYTVISNLKTSFSGTFHALRFKKYEDLYWESFCYPFQRRFTLEEMTTQIFRATCNCTARPKCLPRSAKLATYSKTYTR